jgi:nitroreductase
MDSFDALLNARRSVRAFRPDPVPSDVVRAVFEAAQRTPSNCNIQPWRVTVASGAARDRLRSALLDAVTSGRDAGTEDVIPNFEGEYRPLQVACAVEMYGKMGIARDDKPGRTRAFVRNYELFDAPHVAIIGMDKSFGLGVAIDVGMYVQSLWLGFTERGVGACAMASLRSHPAVVREALDIPEHIRVLCGMAFGYEDTSAAVNATRQPRSPLETNVTFLET